MNIWSYLLLIPSNTFAFSRFHSDTVPSLCNLEIGEIHKINSGLGAHGTRRTILKIMNYSLIESPFPTTLCKAKVVQVFFAFPKSKFIFKADWLM